MTTHNKAILGGFLQTVVAFFVCGPVSGEALSDEFAKVTGQIVLGDRWKKLPPIVEAGATDIKDAEICGARGIPNERLVVDEESLGVSNVFVWLSRPKISDSVRERFENKKMPPVPWTFDGCRLVPHVQCVRAGQTLQMINRDSTAHSPHDYPLKNTVG